MFYGSFLGRGFLVFYISWKRDQKTFKRKGSQKFVELLEKFSETQAKQQGLEKY